MDFGHPTQAILLKTGAARPSAPPRGPCACDAGEVRGSVSASLSVDVPMPDDPAQIEGPAGCGPGLEDGTPGPAARVARDV